jgi:hypothetical protein
LHNVIGWLIFIAVAAFLLRPLFAGFKGAVRADERDSRSLRDAFDAEVVGESHYQSNLSKLTGGRTPDGVEKVMTATLVLEDSNPYDRYAVRVDIDGLTVGYLPKEAARAWRQKGASDRFTCPALICGGWDRGADDKGYFGVRLDLP